MNWFRRELFWRWHLALRKRYLRKTFHNAEQLIQSYLTKTPCAEGLCKDGVVIRHPAIRSGLAQMILEVWFDQVYTGRFYSPSPGDIIIDAGANIGLFSVLLARMQPACRVFAFEPFEENFRLLVANLLSASADNVCPVQIALSGTSGTCEMVDGGARSQDHRLVDASGKNSTTIQTYSFADVLDRVAPGPVALFKCDIEGSEFDFFQSAKPEDIRRVKRFAIEYHNNIRPGTTDLLRERLGPTHDLIPKLDDPNSKAGYGMLYAVSKRLN